MKVGIRELRDGLSGHLATVREGHTITVTDHGRPVARIVPVDAPSKLDVLIAEGKASPARSRRAGLAPPIKSSGTVSDLIPQQRR